MARIHYFIHGRGRGHATRSIPVIDGLRQAGHDVKVFAGEDASPLFSEDEHCQTIRSLMPSQGARILSLFISRVIDSDRSVREARAELVISDGDLPGIVAAHISRIPSIAVGHAEIFSRCRRPEGVPKGPWMREALRAWISAPKATHHVAVNFFSLTPLQAKTVVALPSVVKLSRSEGRDADPIVCYFRDNNGDEILRILVSQGYRPILFSTVPSTVVGIEQRSLNRDEFLSSLTAAKAVVASAGSQLISECVLNDIPIYALFKADDDEQLINVSLLRSARRGDGCPFSQLSEGRLMSFIESVETRRRRKDGRDTTDDDVVTAICRLSQTLLDGRRCRR